MFAFGTEHALVAGVYGLAGLMQGFTGFGSALVAMPLLTLFLDVKDAVVMSVLTGVSLNLFMGTRLRRNVSMAKLGPLLTGCVPGALLGAWFLRNVPGDAVKFLLGVFVAGFGFYSLLFKPKPRGLKLYWGFLAGVVGGVITAMCSAGGPPAVVYTSLTGWDRDTIKGVLAWFFLSMSTLAAISHATAGLTDAYALSLFVCSAPATIAGAFVGLHLGRGVSEAAYRKALYSLLMVMGVSLSLSTL